MPDTLPRVIDGSVLLLGGIGFALAHRHVAELTGRAQRSRPYGLLYSVFMTGEVSPLGRGDEVASHNDLRASHEDRDRVVEVLRVAAGDGRLTPEELDERLEDALTAPTYGELAAVIRDLPAVPGSAASAPVPTPKDLTRIERRSSTASREQPDVVDKARRGGRHRRRGGQQQLHSGPGAVEP